MPSQQFVQSTEIHSILRTHHPIEIDHYRGVAEEAGSLFDLLRQMPLDSGPIGMKEMQNGQGEQAALELEGRVILAGKTGRLQQHDSTGGLGLNA